MRQLEKGENVAEVVARSDELASALHGLDVSDFRMIDDVVADHAVGQARNAADELRATVSSLSLPDSAPPSTTAEIAPNADALRAALAHMSAAETSLDGALKLTRPTPSAIQKVLDEIGATAHTTTQRRAERPYGIGNGFEVNRVRPGEALDLAALDTNKKYIWAIDDGGNFIIAPERQPGFGKNSTYPSGRTLKHGDLMPTSDGKYRGPARAGGEMRVSSRKRADGAHIWVLDNNSSYVFQRARKSSSGRLKSISMSRSKNLVAVKDLLELGGTDISRLRLDNYSGTNVWKYKPPTKPVAKPVVAPRSTEAPKPAQPVAPQGAVEVGAVNTPPSEPAHQGWFKRLFAA